MGGLPASMSIARDARAGANAGGVQLNPLVWLCGANGHLQHNNWGGFKYATGSQWQN